MAASWAEVLDLYGRALLDVERGFDDGTVTGFSFELPSELGPLPPELADVAAGVVALSARVEERTREAMHETAHEQAAVTRARRTALRGRPQAKYVDVSS